MYTELEQLSKTVDFLTEEDARRIISAVNAKMRDLLNAHIIDLLWKIEAKNGIILQPYAGVCLDRTRRGGPRPFQLTDTPVGLWSWVFLNGKSAWIESIRDRRLDSSVKNLIGEDTIEPEYLQFFDETDSILAVPLLFRDAPRGVYCIELSQSGKISPEVVDMVSQLAYPIANIIWKSEAYKLNKEQTSDVVSIFEEVVRAQEIQMSRYRSGFVARPFSEEFDDVERYITDFIQRRGIMAEHYVHPAVGGAVFDEMKSRIADSHFGIVDLTGLNPNVLCELGMLISLNRKFMLLRRSGDQGDLPFDLRGFHYHEYKLEPGPQLRVLNPASGKFEDIEPILERFVENLAQDPKFFEARRWNG